MTAKMELPPLILLEDEPVPSHLVDELKLATFAKVAAAAALGTGGVGMGLGSIDLLDTLYRLHYLDLWAGRLGLMRLLDLAGIGTK